MNKEELKKYRGAARFAAYAADTAWAASYAAWAAWAASWAAYAARAAADDVDYDFYEAATYAAADAARDAENKKSEINFQIDKILERLK